MPSDQLPVWDRVEALRQQLAGVAPRQASSVQQVSTGCDALDQLLPGGALRKGMLVELLAEQLGGGAGSLAVAWATRVVDATRGCLVVVDRWRRFYPPAAVARGIEVNDFVMVRSSEHQMMSAAEELWALDQALRCPGVAVVLAWMDKVDPLAFRRLQLAAEAGQTLAILRRPARVQSLPTWSDVQLLVTPRGKPNRKNESRGQRTRTSTEDRQLSVTLLRQRGPAGNCTPEGTQVELTMDEQGTLEVAERRNESRAMHMAPRMAYSTAPRRSTGA